ncbi:Conserved_hypothetical protein [Hexamita inflata]|uniref:Transmembrane protein n=1 Tax=Hexamita inflata TaxID=28002 RepID=A0AA86QFQ0_9EUKA|nr:Conserved hypothetical protein [Hexamita inflata]
MIKNLFQTSILFLQVFQRMHTQYVYYSAPSTKSASNPCSNKLFVDNTAVCYCFRGESVVQHQGQINFQMDIPFFGVIFAGGKQFRNINLNLNVASDPNLQGFAIQHISSQAVFIECQFKVNVNDSIMQSSLVSGKGDLKIFNCQLEFNSTSLLTAGLVHTAMALSIKDSSLLVDIDGDQIGVIALYAYGAIEVVRVNLLGAVHSLTSQLVHSCFNNPSITVINTTNNLNVVSICLYGAFRQTGSIELNQPELICETSFSIQHLDSLIVSAQSTTQSASTMAGDTVFNNQIFFDTTIFFANGFTTGSATAFSLFGTQVTQFYKLKIDSSSPIQLNCYGSLLSISTGLYFNMISINIQVQTNSSFNFLQNLANTATNIKIQNIKINSIFTGTASGQFSIVQTARGILSIKFYQVTGQYTSSIYSSFGPLISLSSAIIDIKYCKINPSNIAVGNQSSFVFGNVMGKVFIARIIIIYGQSSNLKQLTAITTTLANRFQYGGVVFQLQPQSNATIVNITLLLYINHNTEFIQNSGSIASFNSPTSTLQLRSICIQMKFQSQNIDTFGCLGQITTTVSVENLNYDVDFVNEFIRYKIGLVGVAQGLLISGKFKNIKIKQNMVDIANNGIQDYSALIIAYSMSTNLITFQNILVLQAQINTMSNGGVILGCSQGGTIEISDVVINNTEINCQLQSGLIIGRAITQSNVSISNFAINSSSVMQWDDSAEYLAGVVSVIENSQITIQNGAVNDLGIEKNNNYASAIISKSQSSNCSLQNITINGSKVNGSENIGAVLTDLLTSNLTVQNIYITNCLFNGTTGVGVLGLVNNSNISITNGLIYLTDFTSEQIVGAIANANTSTINIVQFNMSNTSIESQNGYGGFIGGILLNCTIIGTQITVSSSEITQANLNFRAFSGMCAGALQQSKITISSSSFSVTSALDDRTFTLFGQTQKGSINTLIISITGVTFTPLVLKHCIGACINNIGFEMPIICNIEDQNGLVQYFDDQNICQTGNTIT